MVIKDNIRSADILVRFGGEEFILIMPQTTIEGAIEASEKIRSAIEKKEHIITGKQTISIGVAMRIMHESFESWYRRVDAALYRAKNEGRNRVAVYDSSQKMAPDSISLEWREEWESGSTEIDRQHRELLEGANRLIYMSMSGSKHEEMVKLLDLIIEHAVMHFNYEEELLAKIRYPDLEAHARIHKNLAGEAMRLKKSFHEGNIDASAFFSFIADKIILEHMLTSDINYYEYTWKNL
jgi:hemerythrin-like metal-binding protein